MKYRRLAILIEKELIEATRNRLILGFGLIFFVLAQATALIGAISPGATDLQFNRVGVSLLNLGTLLVPLMGLIAGSQGFAGEFEDGTMELLLTQPVRLSELGLGRVIGQWLAIAAALLIGFGSSGLIMILLSSDRNMISFLINLGTSLALALIFLLIGTLISVKAKNRMTALFVALGAWFFYVILYDLIVVQVLMATDGSTSMAVLYALLILNPADLLRVLAIRLTQMPGLFGPSVEAMVALPGFQGPVTASLVFGGWVLGVYRLTIHHLNKRVHSRNPKKFSAKPSGQSIYKAAKTEQALSSKAIDTKA